MSLLAFFVPTVFEAAPFVRQMQISSSTELDSFRLFEGRFKNERHTPVLLIETGMGALCAKEAVNYVLDRFLVEKIWVTGFAAAAKPGIGVGELLIGTEIRSADLPDSENIFTDQKESLLILDFLRQRKIASRQGVFLTVPQLVFDASQKLKMGQNDPAIAFEMETFPIVQAAVQKQIPCTALRWVFDCIDEPIPDFSGFTDARGQWQGLRSIAWLIKRPKVLFECPKFFRRAFRVRQIMADFIKAWVRDVG